MGGWVGGGRRTGCWGGGGGGGGGCSIISSVGLVTNLERGIIASFMPVGREVGGWVGKKRNRE